MRLRRDPLLRFILFWTAAFFMLFWLIFIRTLMDGPTYEWQVLPGVGGQGLGGDAWLPPLLVAFGLVLLFLGKSGARTPFHWLLLAWHGPVAVGAVYLSYQYGDQLRFRGDTLGIDVSLAWVAPFIFGGIALLSVFWVVRDIVSGGYRTGARVLQLNRPLFIVALGMLPVQFVLLRFGEPHGVTDQIGVVLTLIQWWLLYGAIDSTGKAGRLSKTGFVDVLRR